MNNNLQEKKVSWLVARGGKVQKSVVVVKDKNGDIAVVDAFSKVVWIRADREPCPNRCKDTPDLFGGDL